MSKFSNKDIAYIQLLKYWYQLCLESSISYTKQFYIYMFNIIGIPNNPVDKTKIFCGVPFFTKSAYDVLNTSEEQSLPILVTTAAHPNKTPRNK